MFCYVRYVSLPHRLALWLNFEFVHMIIIKISHVAVTSGFTLR